MRLSKNISTQPGPELRQYSTRGDISLSQRVLSSLIIEVIISHHSTMFPSWQIVNADQYYICYRDIFFK